MNIFKRHELLIAGLILLGCALIFTWPLCINLNSAVPVGIEPEAVVMTQLFTAQWTGTALEQGLSYWDPSFFYPYKGAFSWCEPQLLFSVLVWAISKLAGYVCAYNLAILFCMAMFGLTGYAMARLLTNDRVASLWCGLWLTGGAYSIQQLSEPAILAACFPAACILFCLLYARSQKTVFFWAAAIVYILCWFVSKQLAFYLTMILPFILMGYLYRHKWRTPDLVRLSLAAALALALVLPYSLSQLSYTRIMGFEWSPQDISRFSIRLKHLFTPAHGHWLVNRILDLKIYSWDIGVVPLSVIAASVFLGVFKKAQIQDLFRKRLILGLVVMAALALILAFNYRLMHIQFIRIPSRIMVFAIFAVAVLSSFALAHVRSRIKRAAVRGTLTALCFFMLFAEMWAAPVTLFYPDSQISAHSEAINWLAEHGGGRAVLELPLPATYRGYDMQIGAGSQLRMLKHRNPVINGYATFEPTSHKQLRVAFREDTLGRGRRYLQAYGAGYCLVHRPALTGAQEKELERMFAGGPVYADEGHAIYSLPEQENAADEAGFLPLVADCGEKRPRERRVYGVPFSKTLSNAVLIKPRPDWYIDFRWVGTGGSVMSKKVLIRGCVILDAKQARLYVRILKFPRGNHPGEAKLISAEEVGR